MIGRPDQISRSIHSCPHDYQLFTDLDDVNPVAGQAFARVKRPLLAGEFSLPMFRR